MGVEFDTTIVMCVHATVLLYVTADFIEQLLYDRLRKCLSRYTMKSRSTPLYKAHFYWVYIRSVLGLLKAERYVASRTTGVVMVVPDSSLVSLVAGRGRKKSYHPHLGG